MLRKTGPAGPTTTIQTGLASVSRAARGLLLAATASLTLLTACGGDDDDNTGADGATTVSTTDAPAMLDDNVSGGAEDGDNDIADNDIANDDIADNNDTTTEIAPVDLDATATTIEPGDISVTVPTGAPSTMEPVAIDEPAEITPAVSASITSVSAVETSAKLPGEIAGPGVSLTIEFNNNGGDPVNLANVIVDLVGADGVSATPSMTDSQPFSGALATATSATATYVFNIDPALRGDVTVRLSYSAEAPTVLFQGSLA